MSAFAYVDVDGMRRWVPVEWCDVCGMSMPADHETFRHADNPHLYPVQAGAPGRCVAGGAHESANDCQESPAMSNLIDRAACPAWCTAKHPKDPRYRIHDAKVGQLRLGGEIVRVSLEQVDVPDLDGGWTTTRPGHVHLDAHPFADLEDLTPSQTTALANVVDLFAVESFPGAASGPKAEQLRNLLRSAVDMLNPPVEREAS